LKHLEYSDVQGWHVNCFYKTDRMKDIQSIYGRKVATGRNQKGLSLVELLVAISIFGLIAVGATGLLSATLETHTAGTARHDLYREAMMIMERLTNSVGKCTYLFIPNAHQTRRNILAFSGHVNEDNDHYFGDPLFPRIDEDLEKQMTDDVSAGIKNIDDDGDGQIDEGHMNDDDEDGQVDEDPLDGIDNDGDGNVDEDTGDNENVAGMDDDADGFIDEGDDRDDDEDGAVNEDPATATVYSLPAGTSTLQVNTPYNGQTAVLSTRVTTFQVTYEGPNRILIELSLTGESGEIAKFTEHVHLENTFQRIGKRVR
jgi:prepilin-type N-terminal cleavage/methylation domain-containing protein